MINIFYENIDYKYPDKEKLKNWIIWAAAYEKRQIGTINLIFTTDEYLYDLNRVYLDHDYYTDVLTFPFNEPGLISGDIYISIERVKENSTIYNTSFLDELNRVIIHGILHLIGYTDYKEAQKKHMREKENFYLKKFNEL